jgi:hypothetical protein
LLHGSLNSQRHWARADSRQHGSYHRNDFKEPTLDQIDELLRTLEDKGLSEKVRDADGNVGMKPDSQGVPRIVWRILDVPWPPPGRTHFLRLQDASLAERYARDQSKVALKATIKP